MNDEPVRVVFRVEGSPGLVGVLRGVVHFQAIQAGLETDSCDQFARVCEDVCRESLTQFAGADGGIEITIETFADRMEFSVAHRGQTAPAIGLESFAPSEASGGAAGGINGLELLSRVDRVRYSAEDGVARTTLVKFLPPKV
ncbi:MAG TPA: hypothetical protein VNI36_02990 [Candidatus Dormibacteraeota bacterium]|nr:hypothetical protein [Candidatus Dormibacteraeota bacterium]